MHVSETRLSLKAEVFTVLSDVAVLESPDRAILFHQTKTLQMMPWPIPKDSWSVGFFWADTPYHAYHWVQKDGVPLGVHFDIHRDLTIEAKAVRWHDLGLDYWVGQDGLLDWIGDEDSIKGLDQDSKNLLAVIREELDRRGMRLAKGLTTMARTILREHGHLN